MDQITKDRLVSGGIWVFSGRVFSLFAQLALNAIIARLLIPEDMGIYFLVFSLVNFFKMFALLGMQRSIVRIVTSSLALHKQEYARAAVIKVIQYGFFASIAIAILFLSRFGKIVSINIFGSPSMYDIIFLPSIWLVITTTQTLIVESFRGYHDIKCATIFNGLISGIISALTLFLVFCFKANASIELVLYIIIISHSINLGCSLIYLYKYLRKPLLSERMIITPDLLKNSFKLYLTDLVLFVMTSSHLWLLAYFNDKDTVAIFGAVMRFMVIITTTLATLKLAILPTIGHLYAKRKYAELENILRLSATFSGIPALIGLLSLIFFGKFFLHVLFGSNYTSGYSALIVLSTANIINVLTGAPGTLIVMASKEIYLFLFASISCIISILLSWILVKQFSYLGVSIGAGTGIVLYNVMMAFFCSKRLNINTTMSFKSFSLIAFWLKTRKENFIFTHTLRKIL